MSQNIKELYGDKLAGLDGDIGHVHDFYFDDKTWVIRYLVANTGSWLTGRHVLISPHAFGQWHQQQKTLQVKLKKKQIEDSPSLESHQQVSRPYEMEYYRYYGWPAYWDGGGAGPGPSPSELPPSQADMATLLRRPHRDDEHLQSTKGVTGYHLQATDGTIGQVTDFLADNMSWVIRELVVETGHWYSGKEILIPIGKIEKISYEESKVFVTLTKAEIQRTGDHDVAKTGGRSQQG